MSVVSGWADEHEPMTVDDLKRLPDDGRRYELVDGRLDVSPSATRKHGRVENRLAFVLTGSAPDEYEVLSDIGINLNAARTHHRIPDVMVRLDVEDEDYPIKPPVLAVEVVSTESVLRDHHIKRREYAGFGIEAYWIITPSAENPSILEFCLENGEYQAVQEVLGEDTFATDFPFPVKFVPHWLVASGSWRDRIGGEGD